MLFPCPIQVNNSLLPTRLQSICQLSDKDCSRVRILARILAKCELKKQLARWYFLYLQFLASGNLGLLSVVLILDINLLSSFLKYLSLTVNVFVFIHRKTLPMAEVYIGYNLNAQTHTINSTAWSGLSQSYAF